MAEMFLPDEFMASCRPLSKTIVFLHAPAVLRFSFGSSF